MTMNARPSPLQRKLKSVANLTLELFAFARAHKAWWILPVMAILLLLALVVVSVSAVSPFIYTLF